MEEALEKVKSGNIKLWKNIVPFRKPFLIKEVLSEIVELTTAIIG